MVSFIPEIFSYSNVPLHSSLHSMVKDVRLMLIWANLPIPFVELFLVEVPVPLFTYSCFLGMPLLALGPYARRLFYPFGQSVTGL